MARKRTTPDLRFKENRILDPRRAKRPPGRPLIPLLQREQLRLKFVATFGHGPEEAPAAWELVLDAYRLGAER